MKKFRRNSVSSPKSLMTLLLALFLMLPQSLAKAEDEPGISNSEIRLGSSYPITGAASILLKDFFVGANAYFSYLNENGGIYGRKVMVIYKDDKGIPSSAVTANNELILKDKVFALFNSASWSAGQIAILKSIQLGSRGIPNLAVMAPYSDLANQKKYSTTFKFNPSSRQDAALLLNFVSNQFPSTPFHLYYTDNDIGADLMGVFPTTRKKYDVVRGYITQPGEMGRNTESQGIINFGDVAGLATPGSKIVGATSNNFPLVVRGASVNGLEISPNTTNLYASQYLPLYTDLNDPFIDFFTGILNLYSPGTKITQEMVEGANTAYVVSQALAAIGSQPTRAKLIDFLRKSSNSLSTASFGPLDFSSGSGSGNFVQYLAKYESGKWTRASDLFAVNGLGTTVVISSISRSTLLPKGLPVMKSSATQAKVTIVCTKGKLTKKVTAVNPKCPTGYKKK